MEIRGKVAIVTGASLGIGRASYGSDVFWPCTPERYQEQFLQPQLGLFETACTLSHHAKRTRKAS